MEHFLPPGREAPFQIPYVEKPQKFRAAFLDRVEYTTSLTQAFWAMADECKDNQNIDPLAVFQYHFSLHRTRHAMILQRACPNTALHECMAGNGGWHEDIGLLQEWMFFALLECAMQGSVDRDDFLAKRDNGSTVYNTSRLNDYLWAWKSKDPIIQRRNDTANGALSQASNAPERSTIRASVSENVQGSVSIGLDQSEAKEPTVLDFDDDDPAASLQQPESSDPGASLENLYLAGENTSPGTSTNGEERVTGGTSDGEYRHAEFTAPNDNQRRGAAYAIETVLDSNSTFLSYVAGYLYQCHAFLDRRIGSGGVSHVTRLQSFLKSLGLSQTLGAVLHNALCYVAFPAAQWTRATMGLYDVPTVERSISASTRCPWFRSTFLSEAENLNWALYVFSLGTIREQLDHKRCTARACIEINAVPGSRLQHTQAHCRCGPVEIAHHEIASILRRGFIPLIRFQSVDDGQNHLEVVELSGDETYVAFSPVWVDGLGDQANNTVAACQLRRIKEGLSLLANSFALTSSAPLTFWLDALCIPANEENDDYQHFRDLSICRMHDIYANASAVLILDPDIWCLPESTSATEVMLKLHISAHVARLWTYQETTLCPRVYALGKGCIHDLRGLSSQLEREALLGRIPNYALAPHRKVFGLGGTTVDPNQILYAIQTRASSRSDDECICIATLMGINTEQLTAAAPVDRMAILLQSMSSIPVTALFAYGPRLKIPGLRWAPESFLTAFGGGMSTLLDLSMASGFTAHLAPKDRGLCIDLPAIKLGLAGWWDPDGRFHCALGSTMLWFRAYDKSGKWEKKTQLKLLMLLHAHHQARDLRYLSGRYEIETYDGPPAGPKTELAVLVLSNPAFSGKFEMGVMVELRHDQATLESTCTTHEDVVVCNWCCVVQVWRVDRSRST